MSYKVLSLFTCPFCRPRTGQITVDTAALAAYRVKTIAERAPCLHADPQQSVLFFNSDSPTSKPCPHLFDVQLDIDFWCEEPNSLIASDRWGTCFDWQHPLAKKADPDELQRDFWVREFQGARSVCLACGDYHHRPKTRFRFVGTNLAWRDFTVADVQNPKFAVEGRAVFVADVAAFIREIRPLYRKHCACARKISKMSTDETEMYEFVPVE